MLQKLFIRNYAIIESVEIEFSGKLNIITGETGAGKSILVGALGLILGERADSSVLFNADQKCIVEGSFSIHGRNDIQQTLQRPGCRRSTCNKKRSGINRQIKSFY